MNSSQIISLAYRKAVTGQLLSASLGQDVQEYPSTLKEFCIFYLKLLYDLQSAALQAVSQINSMCLCVYLALEAMNS